MKNEELIKLNKEYVKLQNKYGSNKLDAICNGGCENNPDICFVFMNPTGRNIASSKDWKGIKSPWIGTKNIWGLFNDLNLLNKDIYEKIKGIKGKEWSEEFAKSVYDDVTNHKYYITNLGKCTQDDARALPDSVFLNYLKLLKKEISIVKPKVIILFGNQVSSIVLDEKISVSTSRKKLYTRKIGKEEYHFYCVYYPVGNGIFNIDKSIEDIKWIMENDSNLK